MGGFTIKEIRLYRVSVPLKNHFLRICKQWLIGKVLL